MSPDNPVAINRVAHTHIHFRDMPWAPPPGLLVPICRGGSVSLSTYQDG
jgi:hypothetical protein